MARRNVRMEEYLELVYQWHRGRSIRQIRDSLQISRKTIRKYLRLFMARGLSREKPLPPQEELARIGLTLAAELIEQDWDRMVTFYNYPKKQWQHLRTTNPVESPFAALRLRTDAAKRFKKVENAQAVIWKMLLVAEQRFRRLKAPELMKDVYQGAKYVNGVPVNQAPEEKAA